MWIQTLRGSPWSTGRVLLTLALTISLLCGAAMASDVKQCGTEGEEFKIMGNCTALAKVESPILNFTVDPGATPDDKDAYPGCNQDAKNLYRTFYLNIGGCNVTISGCSWNMDEPQGFRFAVRTSNKNPARDGLTWLAISKERIELPPDMAYNVSCKPPIVFEEITVGDKKAWTVNVTLNGNVSEKFSLTDKKAHVYVPPKSDSKGSGMATWVLALIITGPIVLLLTSSIVGAVFYCRRRKQTEAAAVTEADAEAAQLKTAILAAEQSDTPDGEKKQQQQPPAKGKSKEVTNKKSKELEGGPAAKPKSKEDNRKRKSKSKDGAERKSQEAEPKSKQQPEASKNEAPPTSKNDAPEESDKEKKPDKKKGGGGKSKQASITKRAHNSQSARSPKSDEFPVMPAAQVISAAQAAAEYPKSTTDRTNS